MKHLNGIWIHSILESTNYHQYEKLPSENRPSNGTDFDSNKDCLIDSSQKKPGEKYSKL